MKSFIILALFVAAAVATPASRNADDNDALEASDSIQQPELDENEAIADHGQYSYPGPDGTLHTVKFVADSNGLHPQGTFVYKGP